MAFEIVHLVKKIELDVDTDGVMTFELRTDQPGDVVAVRYASDFNTEATTSGRRTVKFTVPGTTRGKLVRGKIYGLAVGRLYGARVYARPLGGPGAWTWYPFPVRATADAYAAAALPIRETSAGYQPASLPIRPTGEYTSAQLPIRPTPADWARGGLPIPETALIPHWVTLAVDAVE